MEPPHPAPAPRTEIPFAFDRGDEVMALPLHPWRSARRARVMRRESYQERPGYYVAYLDARHDWECHGGWLPETALRRPDEPTPSPGT